MGEKKEIGWLELVHEEKRNWLGSNSCSQRCHAPEKRRLYSCMLIKCTYGQSFYVGKCTEIDQWPHCISKSDFGLEGGEDGLLIREKWVALFAEHARKQCQPKLTNTTNVISHQQEHYPDLHSEVSPAQGKVLQWSSLLYRRSLIKSANTNRVLPVLVSWIEQSATFLPAVLHCM